MPRHYRTIQRDLVALIEAEMAKHADAKIPLMEVEFPEPRCPLVNPLCPGDLCYLPAGHVGSAEGYHILGTDNYTQPFRYVYKEGVCFMMEPGLSREELEEIGWKRANQLWPYSGTHY